MSIMKGMSQGLKNEIAMKREELIAYDNWLTSNKWGSSVIITPEQAADLYLAEHPLPPAEGAEQEKILTDFAEKMNTAMVNNDPEFEQIVNDHYFDLIEQPTAEGAEEILDGMDLGEPIQTGEFYYRSEVLEAMNKFATLHAHRIADKMVEWISVKDKLPEEHEDVLCYNGHRISSHNWCKYTGQDDKWFKETFTHWGKLPKLPKS